MTLTNYGAENSSGGANAVANGARAVAVGNDTSASGEESTAIGNGARATGTNSLAISADYTDNATASGQGSVAIGHGGASGQFAITMSPDPSYNAGVRSIVLGKANIGSGGSKAFSAQIDSHSSSYGGQGANSIALGMNARAAAGNSVAIGSRAQSVNSSIALCTSYANYGNNAGGGNSICIGDGSSATRTSSVAIGYGAKSDIDGKFVYASRSFGDGNAEGSSQGGWFILVSDTTDATPEAMTTTKSSAGSSNQVVAKTDTCITFSGTIVAMQNGAQSYGSWEIRGLLVNDGGTTTLPVSNVSEIGSSGWKVSLRADNTNNALTVQITGEASTNIRWVANIQTAEVTYA